MLAVVDHVEPDLRLALHDLFHRAGNAAVQKLGAVVSAELLPVQNINQVRRTRQAPRMGREDLLGAGSHAACCIADV